LQLRKCYTVAAGAILGLTLTILAPGNGSADPIDRVVAEPAPATGTAQPPTERNARYACLSVLEPKDLNDDLSGAEAQLRNPDNRIEGLDWSGQDLSGKNFSGKVLIHVKLKGAKLRGADLTDAIICGSNLNDVDLTGAHLDRALIGGDTEMKNANLANVSGRALKIANTLAWGIRIDGADLRDARLICDLSDEPRCYGTGIEFASMVGADLRGATIDDLSISPPSLAAARLDHVTTHLVGTGGLDLGKLADGVGDSGTITFIPWHGQSGVQTDFTGNELRQLAGILRHMEPASAHPSFDCARAKTGVENAICADPKLAALDSALNWLWQRVEHTPEQLAAQKKWAAARATCRPNNDVSPLSSESFSASSDPKGCIGIAYAERIRQLAPKSSSAVVGSGTYTTDSPLELPKGQHSALARKFLMARGYRQDEIAVENLGNGTGKVSGFGLWANGHECGLVASERQTQRTGSRFRINDDPADPEEKYSVSFAITPQVVIWAGGSRQFQCGARGGWSDVYFRQPDDLISSTKKLSGTQ
jgi:uncharacterized protein YjbI with pentapeptide repeats